MILEKNEWKSIVGIVLTPRLKIEPYQSQIGDGFWLAGRKTNEKAIKEMDAG